MADLGADYSWARPGGGALRNAGVRGVGRYLADQGDGREIEIGEYNDLRAHGLDVWFVREGAANGMLNGYGKGVSDAQIAKANLARLGITGPQVVYAAADFDVQESQYRALDGYMQGFASIIGLPYTGIYAGMRYINHCRDVGLAGWFWKAAASSWDHGQGGSVHIEQTTRTPPVSGSDHNFIYTNSYGQVGSVASLTGGREMAAIVTVDDWNGGMMFLVVPGSYIIYITEPDPHLVSARALTPFESHINSGQVQALLDECAMGNYTPQNLLDAAGSPSKILVCSALSGFWTTNAVVSDAQIEKIKSPLTDEQVQAIAADIAKNTTGGISQDEVQAAVTNALQGLKLGVLA